jgi:hypothetical protein
MDQTTLKFLLIAGGIYVVWQNWRAINLADPADNVAAFYNPFLYKKTLLYHSNPVKYFTQYGSETVLIDPELGVPKFAERTSQRIDTVTQSPSYW